MEANSLVFFLISCVVVFFLAVAITRYAWRKGFFRPLAKSPCPTLRITWQQLIAAFGIYFVITLLYSPLALLFLQHQHQSSWMLWGGWMHLLYLLFLLSGLLLYLWKQPSILHLFFLQHSWKQRFRSFGLGAFTWILAAPWVFLTHQITEYITHHIWSDSAPEQVAVQHLKEIWSYPSLYVTTLLFMCVCVPILEEILFRGFLQTFLRSWCTRWGSLLITACIFSLVHFGIAQEISNFTILSALFPLSILLGYLYEREQNLWAPIGLHIVFNSLSAIFVTMKLW